MGKKSGIDGERKNFKLNTWMYLYNLLSDMISLKGNQLFSTCTEDEVNDSLWMYWVIQRNKIMYNITQICFFIVFSSFIQSAPEEPLKPSLKKPPSEAKIEEVTPPVKTEPPPVPTLEPEPIVEPPVKPFPNGETKVDEEKAPDKTDNGWVMDST